MEELNYGENDEQISKKFREICSSHIQMFKNTKNHIRSLLGSSYPYQSGIFRESLLRNFLEGILPQSLSIDTGFIYGFDEYENSKQIDILIWNSHKYSPIYRTKEFVIVPPESVAAIIEVKSKFSKRDLLEGLTNLLSVAKLDIQFRAKWVDENNNPILPPIGKFLVTYRSGTKPETIINNISDFYKTVFETSEYLCEEFIPVLQRFNPTNPSENDRDMFDRIFPKVIVSIENKNSSFYRGFGSPENINSESVDHSLKRLPYIYQQNCKITTPFEKFVGELLHIVFRNLKTNGWSTMYAWADLNPVSGARVGDMNELIINTGKSLLDVHRLNYQNNNT
jgi:hypothetical protein